VADGQRAQQLLGETEFDVVLTDLKMPKSSGIEVLRATKSLYPATEVVLLTAFATAETAIEAMKLGAYDYLTKPFKVDEILVTVQRALEKRKLVRDNETLRRQLTDRYQLDNLVGRSPAMLAVFDLIRKVANTKTSVLITGESGTGKELVARAVHAVSDRRDYPFVPINCGAIPDALMESELFGHVRGAFTGANADKDGLFAAAHGGTVFLDEIAEISPSMQVKLLRTLQERTVKPVGGIKEMPVDVRVLAASNRDLDEEIKAGRFRSDLFYRLNVIPIHIPPLRERSRDIPLLVEHFIRKSTVEMDRPAPTLTADALGRLCRYHYPGNVRELENLVERAVALTPVGHPLDLSALPELHPSPSPASSIGPQIPEGGMDLDQHIGQIERSLLTDALERTAGNRSAAAQLLGVTMRSLRYRLAKYGISND